MKYMIGMVLLAVVGCSILILAAHKQDQYDTACRAKGGIPYHSRESRDICLRPEAVIK